MLPPLNHTIDQSIQALPDAVTNPLASGFWENRDMRGPLLAPFGTRARERQLRAIYRHDYNGLVRGAFAGVAKTIASTAFEIKGPEEISKDTAKYYRATAKAVGMSITEDSKRPDIEYFQELLRQADFGRGWTTFIQKVIKDYLRQDGGGFIEVIAAGKASKAPAGAVTGLAALDSLRVLPTGDPEYPALYWNMKGEYHLIHAGRLIQLQDMPDSDEIRPGYGECALSRAVGLAQREILMGRYIEAQLDDLPSPGFMTASGMLDSQRQKALMLYRQDQNADSQPEWGKLMWFFSQDPTIPVKLEQVAFQQPPEKFDFEQYTTIDVDSLALALGVDRQELWQLSGGNIGSGSQSETLAQKSRGKTLGIIRAELTRQINDLLPDEYVFEFKYEDAAEEKEKAATAQMWVDAVTKLNNVLSVDEQRRLLADTVKAIQDVVTDENGEMVTATDADVQPPAQVIAADITANARLNASNGGQDGGAPNNGGADSAVREPSNTGTQVGRRDYTDTTSKAIQSTRLEFEDALADAIDRRQKGKMTAARFGIIARDLLRKWGLQAFRDGLEDGGVQPYEENGAPLPLDASEQKAYTNWLAEQSAYVSRLSNELNTTEELNADYRASLWGNKSLMSIYQAGLISADKNGMYRWELGKTEKHCKDCSRLSGQVHRLKDYQRRRLLPNSDALECTGMNCDCKLIKTTERAKGRF